MISYDVTYNLRSFYSGKIATGKRAKRTTDSIDERCNMSQYPEHGSYTDEILRDARLDSPEPTLSAPGSSMPGYDWNQNIYGDDVDTSYGGFTEPQGSNANPVSTVEDQT